MEKEDFWGQLLFSSPKLRERKRIVTENLRVVRMPLTNQQVEHLKLAQCLMSIISQKAGKEKKCFSALEHL